MIDQIKAALGPYALQILDQLKPLNELQIFLGSLGAFTAFYAVGSILIATLSSKAKAARRSAWVITLLSSLVMTVCGSFFALRLWETQGDLEQLNDTDTFVSKALCIFFLAYCIIDMFFAFLHYHEEVGIGYSHHTGYIILITYFLVEDRPLLFAIFSIEEIPTLFLSIYEIMGDTRPRLTTGMTIFAFRISYHLYVTYKATQMASPWLFFLSVYLLSHHITWFRSWFFRRVEHKRGQAEEPPKSKTTGEAAKHERELTMEVTAHVYLVAALFVAQILMHLYLVVSEVRTSLVPQADFGSRDLTLLKDVAVILGHIVTFFYATMTFAGILHDVYEQHFIMHTIEHKTIIYNISWEDPRVERELLKIGSNDVILTISSAGCNVLDYLIEGPKAIVACDFNIAQLSVLALKLQCIKHLDYEDYFKIWAESDFEVFQKHYPSLRPHLQPEHAEFWDENQNLIKENFMFAGTSGLAAKLMRPALRFLGVVDYMVQRKGYPPANMGLALVRSFLQLQWVWAILAPLGGVPRSQLDLVKREPEVWSERLEEVLGRRMWLPDNYFYYAYIAGKWSKECCPRYLEEKNFSNLREYADRVQLFHGPIAAASQLRNDFTVASLLDSMDWMPDSMIADQLQALIPQMQAGPKGHIFWRSFATKVHSPVLASLLPKLVPDEDGSERVGWYLTQWVAQVPENVNYTKMITACNEAQYVNSTAQDISVMCAMAIHGLRQTKDVKAFYRSQGKNYDGFREALLPDRDVLLKYCLPWQTVPKNWLSVGCGTARDIEYVVDNLVACETQLYLFDLSPELLEMATERVRRYNLQKQVTFIQGDICKAWNSDGTPNNNELNIFDADGKPVTTLAKQLPPMGSFDIVTCSYCLTMIPPWKEALEAMVGAVKKGGSLAIIDFTKRTDRPNHWSQNLNQWWFANDGVYFNDAQPTALREHPDLQEAWYTEAEARVPYTLLEATHYLYTGIKR